ncbi:hypothetical protein [Halalkalicoccus jeotgali]|uniref:Uncharacterized protein n=1 Tax=Halalkalicoccus jeotgali (strain DSM 18796 / CECT 7217 / JCM 14584 / KCTC 4019 / B3) TaxID=795797 RepID=D8J3D6_HALJB|nr:hypothetical protein [Halalkalicoccus jeotgali]ADJ15243.1 hypothetical protein HacjB3_09300 [Halalkalicoccus jeotgali B3]ELY35336.1 hypothetical protein C497_13376 [Halalkalicoccus jeotgali B3]
MDSAPNRLNAARRAIKPPIHRLFDWAFGGYAMTDNTEEEYVGTVQMSQPELETLLANAGFRRNVVSSLKVRIDGNISDGSWAWRESPLADWQLHVILHDVGESVEVYAHWEYSWITNPIKHYAATGCSPERGVEMTRTFLGNYHSGTYPDGIPFEIESFYWRKPWYLTRLHNVSERVNGGAERLEKWASGVKRSISARRS